MPDKNDTPEQELDLGLPPRPAVDADERLAVRPGSAPLRVSLPGATAVRIDPSARLITVDGRSTYGPDEPAVPEWVIRDLRDGTYGDFHRLRPAGECMDADCIERGEHDVPDEVTVSRADLSAVLAAAHGLCEPGAFNRCAQAAGLVTP